MTIEKINGNEFFDTFKNQCVELYEPTLKEYEELIKEIDNDILKKYGEKIKKYKERIIVYRTMLNKKGPYPNRYLDLVKIGDEK